MLQYKVKSISCKIGRAFIQQHHYSHSVAFAPQCYGLFEDDSLIGALAVQTPVSENVRSCLLGKDFKQHVTELHRLVLLDEAPRNSESFFISRALKLHKFYQPKIWLVMSYADESEGHIGTIYQATNALYLGTTGRRTRFYRDSAGILHHPRQQGLYIDLEEAKSRGWTPELREPKHRYVFLLPNSRAHRRWMESKINRLILPYPKKIVT